MRAQSFVPVLRRLPEALLSTMSRGRLSFPSVAFLVEGEDDPSPKGFDGPGSAGVTKGIGQLDAKHNHKKTHTTDDVVRCEHLGLEFDRRKSLGNVEVSGEFFEGLFFLRMRCEVHCLDGFWHVINFVLREVMCNQMCVPDELGIGVNNEVNGIGIQTATKGRVCGDFINSRTEIIPRSATTET